MIAAYEDLADAFEVYVRALYDAFGEMTPLDIYTEDGEGERDDDDEDEDDGTDEVDAHDDEDGDDAHLYAGLDDDIDFEDDDGVGGPTTNRMPTAGTLSKRRHPTRLWCESAVGGGGV